MTDAYAQREWLLMARIGSVGPVQTLPLLGTKRPCDQACYAATLVGLDSEQAPRLLILSTVLCCDLMAIVLVIAASARRQVG